MPFIHGLFVVWEFVNPTHKRAQSDFWRLYGDFVRNGMHWPGKPGCFARHLAVRRCVGRFQSVVSDALKPPHRIAGSVIARRWVWLFAHQRAVRGSAPNICDSALSPGANATESRTSCGRNSKKERFCKK